MNEHGYCPYCGVDFDGEDIVKTFINQGNTPEKALKDAQTFYKYREGYTKWGKEIAIYCLNTDKTVSYKCFKCNFEFKKF